MQFSILIISINQSISQKKKKEKKKKKNNENVIDVTRCSGILIADFEQVNAGWKNYSFNINEQGVSAKNGFTTNALKSVQSKFGS